MNKNKRNSGNKELSKNGSISDNKITNTLIVEWNTIIFEFNVPNKDEWDISEDFDFQKKPFVTTTGTYDLIDLSEFELLSSPLIFKMVKQTLKKKVIWEIIITIFEKAKNIRLDYLQKLSINGTKCWVIDNGSDICLMLPEEY